MSRNGSGTFSLLTNSWNPAVNGATATASDWQALINDVAAAITQSLSKDGQTPLTGNLPMGGNKLTGLANGSASTDSTAFGQLTAATGSGSGNRNRLINANFAFNQRGVSGTVTLGAGIYGHDRWKAGAGGCTYTFAASGVDTVITITAGTLIQTIEASFIEGGNYVMSWAGTAQGKIGGGSFGATGVNASGVTANANLNVEFNTGTLGTVQLEPGTVASNFERKSFILEFLSCLRYYAAGSASIYGYAGAGGVSIAYRVPFKNQMRVTPTLTYASVTNTNVTTFDARTPSPTDFLWFSASTAAGGTVWDGTWTASAEL